VSVFVCAHVCVKTLCLFVCARVCARAFLFANNIHTNLIACTLSFSAISQLQGHFRGLRVNLSPIFAACRHPLKFGPKDPKTRNWNTSRQPRRTFTHDRERERETERERISVRSISPALALSRERTDRERDRELISLSLSRARSLSSKRIKRTNAV
jgi:hypothetical protein